MSPIEPARLTAPVLLGGPHATAFAEFAAPLGFTGLEPYAEVVGPAAATKLCRSVVIKGVESLLTESMLTARAWGGGRPGARLAVEPAAGAGLAGAGGVHDLPLGAPRHPPRGGTPRGAPYHTR